MSYKKEREQNSIDLYGKFDRLSELNILMLRLQWNSLMRYHLSPII